LCTTKTGPFLLVYYSRMNSLRFLMLLALTAWLGALIFFPVVAQTSFSLLPSSQLAGLVVRGSIIKLHWMGLGCGAVFLACSRIYNNVEPGRARIFTLSHVAIAVMLALTAISQFVIIPRMDSLRGQSGEIDSLTANDPIRAQFDSLHVWSTRTELGVLLLGLLVLYVTARRLASAARA
jgi:hypothetical protein